MASGQLTEHGLAHISARKCFPEVFIHTISLRKEAYFTPFWDLLKAGSPSWKYTQGRLQVSRSVLNWKLESSAHFASEKKINAFFPISPQEANDLSDQTSRRCWCITPGLPLYALTATHFQLQPLPVANQLYTAGTRF